MDGTIDSAESSTYTDFVHFERTSEADQKLLQRAKKRKKIMTTCPFEEQLRKDSEDNLKYVTGSDQGWGEARAKLEGEGKPVLTLNRIMSIIRLICGARPAITTKFFPVEDGDLETASVFNACKMHIDNFNRWEMQAEEIFKRMILIGRSVVGLMPDYDVCLEGEVKKILYDGLEFWYDPDAKAKDYSDAEDMCRIVSIPPAKAKRLFPKFKDQIELLVGAEEEQVSSGNVHRETAGPDQYANEVDDDRMYYDPATKKLTLVFYWYKKYRNITKVYDTLLDVSLETDKPIDDVKAKIEKLTGDMDRFLFFERTYTDVKYIIYTGGLLLEKGSTPWEREDGEPTTLSSNFPFVTMEPDKIVAGGRKELIQVIAPMKDPQKMYNKLASLIFHILATTASSGWEYEEGAFVDPEDKKKLEKRGSSPGGIFRWAKNVIYEGRARKIQPSPPPQAQMVEAKEMAAEVLNISGVESLLSTQTLGKNASGLAIDLKQQQGSNIINWLYKSFNYFQHVLTEYERDAIQVMYNYEKVIRIKGHKPKYVTINEQVYDEEGGITQILNDVTTGRYDFTIAEKMITPGMRVERFKYFVELVKGGALPLPQQVLVKMVLVLMDDPELKQIMESELEEFSQNMTGPQPSEAITE